LTVSRNSANSFDQTIVGAISRELHNTAQPLTILQGVLDLMLCSTSIDEDCKSQLVRAVEEVRRVTERFEDIRKLVALQRPAPDVATFPLSMLMNDVVQNLKSNLETSNIVAVLHPQPNQDLPAVFVTVSQTRAFNAIRLVFAALMNRLHAGDRIGVIIEEDGTRAAIRLLPSRLHPSELPTVVSELLFAHVVLTTLGGEIRWNELPDELVVSFPAVAPQSGVPGRQWKAMHV
jgi:hypothetical protein